MSSSGWRAAVVAAVVAGAVLIGCGGDSEETSSGGSPASGTGGTVTVAWATPPDTLNPAGSSARATLSIVSNIFDTLVHIAQDDFEVQPDLATSWEASPDGKTYTFELRDDVTFHDGTPFNAEAVVANFEYILDEETQSPLAGTLLGPCTKASATAEFTVEVRCERPFSPLLRQLAMPVFGMQSPAAIKKYGKDLAAHPTGTGPFKFVSYKTNESVVLERNPDYNWAPEGLDKSGPAGISRLEFLIVPDPQARISALQSGQAQVISQTPGAFFKQFEEGGNFQAVGVPISGLGIWGPINAGRWPTNSKAVRQAILYSMDKREVLQLSTHGVFEPSWAPLSEGLLGHDPSLEGTYDYDPAKAEQLLTGDGWQKVNGVWTKDGKQLTLDITALPTTEEYVLIAESVQAQLERAGMKAKIRQMATEAWRAANTSGDFSLTWTQLSALDPDGIRLYLEPGDFNWTHFTDRELTRLFDQGAEELDPEKRAVIYQEIQRRILDEAVMMFMHYNEELLSHSNDLDGIAWDGGGYISFYAVTREA